MRIGQIKSAGLLALLAATALVTAPWADEVRDHLTREVETGHDDAARAAKARGGEVLRLDAAHRSGRPRPPLATRLPRAQSPSHPSCRSATPRLQTTQLGQ